MSPHRKPISFGTLAVLLWSRCDMGNAVRDTKSGLIMYVDGIGGIVEMPEQARAHSASDFSQWREKEDAEKGGDRLQHFNVSREGTSDNRGSVTHPPNQTTPLVEENDLVPLVDHIPSQFWEEMSGILDNESHPGTGQPTGEYRNRGLDCDPFDLDLRKQWTWQTGDRNIYRGPEKCLPVFSGDQTARMFFDRFNPASEETLHTAMSVELNRFDVLVSFATRFRNSGESAPVASNDRGGMLLVSEMLPKILQQDSPEGVEPRIYIDSKVLHDQYGAFRAEIDQEKHYMSRNAYWMEWYQMAMSVIPVMLYLIGGDWLASSNCWEELSWLSSPSVDRQKKTTVILLMDQVAREEYYETDRTHHQQLLEHIHQARESRDVDLRVLEAWDEVKRIVEKEGYLFAPRMTDMGSIYGFNGE